MTFYRVTMAGGLRRESGVALIFVLLIFTIIVVVATRMATRLYHNTEKYSRYLQFVQAKHYALGAEEYVALLLEEDKKKDKQQGQLIDHWFESWADAGADNSFSVADGEITIQVLDDQGRFNLNQLADAKNREILEAAIRLFSNEKIDPRLAYRIRDWINAEQAAEASGAGNNLYLTSSPPYKEGNTLLASVSELNLLQILTPEEYERLLPHVTVLPDSQAGLNVNTITAEVFRSLSDQLSESDSTSFISERGREGFSNIQIFLQHPLLKGKVSQASIEKLRLDVKSRFFSVYVQAVYRDVTFYLHSRLSRDDNGKVMVVGRELDVSPNWVAALRKSVR
ncbi:MAG: type II secretion system minor pseudopilin GspK [Endozoicomonadaceae bacterium]|nr:type II secretion system minor pseudopilin GspK [Endozoicomonadaceae bacterium]